MIPLLMSESLLGRKCMPGLMVVGHTVNQEMELNTWLDDKK